MIAWIVCRGDAYAKDVYDTVFYAAACDAEDVRTTLINHDGYPSDILVERE